MKLKSLLIGDLKFQYRYGFFFVYAIFVLIYISISSVVAESIKSQIVLLMIFSDPVILGLVFSGSMIHLELDEKTFQALIVSPIDYKTYTISKLASFSFISLIVSLIIGYATNSISNIIIFSIGIILGSIIFTSFGLIISFISKSLNQFMLQIIPIMVLILLPGAYDLFFDGHSLLFLHPGVAIMRLLSMQGNLLGAFVSLLFWSVFVVYLCFIRVKKAFLKQGGGHHKTDN